MRLENSFIIFPGVGERRERKLWRSGIRHWEELDPDQVPGVSSSRARKFLSKARKNLEVENSHFFDSRLPSGELWRMYRNFESSTCFFDIETTGLDQSGDRVTTVSLHRGGETRTLVRGEDLSSETLKRELEGSDLLVSFNGKRFDVPFLEKSFEISVDRPHLDLMYMCRSCGLNGGLKEVERKLGIERQGDVDGREAVRLWRMYEDGDGEALERLVSYNRKDAENLRTLLERLHSRARPGLVE